MHVKSKGNKKTHTYLCKILIFVYWHAVNCSCQAQYHAQTARPHGSSLNEICLCWNQLLYIYRLDSGCIANWACWATTSLSHRLKNYSVFGWQEKIWFLLLKIILGLYLDFSAAWIQRSWLTKCLLSPSGYCCNWKDRRVSLWASTDTLRRVPLTCYVVIVVTQVRLYNVTYQTLQLNSYIRWVYGCEVILASLG